MGGPPIYLLYLDESGRAKHPSDQYLVMGGVALHEEDCFPLARSLDKLQRKKLGPANADLELHASRMWAGRSEWARLPIGDRRGMIRSVFRHLSTWTAPSGRGPVFFAVAVHKPSRPGKDPTEIAHEEIFMRFDEFLTRLHHDGESHRSLVVADESSYERLVQTWVPRWKAVGARGGKLHSFAEVPLYVDSRASRLVQVADMVAWSTWHYYEHGHTDFLQRLHPRFDANAGVQHGLAHLTRRHRHCSCQPCASRRNHKIDVQITVHPL